MRKKLLVGNWKLNGTKASIQGLLHDLKRGIVGESTQTPQVIVLPPAIFMQQVAQDLQQSPILWGGQNMAEHHTGAYTGEISGDMLKAFGCQYVLLGHSERRQYYGESDENILRKLILAKEIGLMPILCLGETWEAYQCGQTEAALIDQLSFYCTLGTRIFKNLIIAYEPIWAIGTGKSPTPLEVQRIHERLRLHIKQHIGSSLAQQICILYGGSVKADNAAALFSMPDIDGGLIGSAALSADTFLPIYRSLL